MKADEAALGSQPVSAEHCGLLPAADSGQISPSLDLLKDLLHCCFLQNLVSFCLVGQLLNPPSSSHWLLPLQEDVA